MQMQAHLLFMIADHMEHISQWLCPEREREQRVDEISGLQPPLSKHTKLVGEAETGALVPALEVRRQFSLTACAGGKRRMGPTGRIRPDLGIDCDEDVQHEVHPCGRSVPDATRSAC